MPLSQTASCVLLRVKSDNIIVVICYRKKRLMSSSFAHIALMILFSSISNCTMPETSVSECRQALEIRRAHNLILPLMCDMYSLHIIPTVIFVHYCFSFYFIFMMVKFRYPTTHLLCHMVKLMKIAFNHTKSLNQCNLNLKYTHIPDHS